MANGKSDFFNIAELSRALRQATEHVKDNANPAVSNAAMLVYQANCQLAIAQQLSVISGHLGRLVELCEDQRK